MRRTEEEIREMAREMVNQPTECYQKIVSEYHDAEDYDGNLMSMAEYMELVQLTVEDELRVNAKRITAQGGRHPQIDKETEEVEEVEEVEETVKPAYVVGARPVEKYQENLLTTRLVEYGALVVGFTLLMFFIYAILMNAAFR